MSYISDFFASFDSVFCISLVSSYERRAHILALVKEYSIENLSFIDAVPASDPLVNDYYRNGLVKSFPTCFRCGKTECGDDYCNNTLIPSQVATFLSYLKLWRCVAEANIGAALIVEDDIRLTDRAEKIGKSIIDKNLIRQTGIYGKKPMLLRFGWALCDDHKSESDFFFSSIQKMANPAHAINRSMAKQLLSKFESIDTTVDIYQHQVCSTEHNSQTGYPPIFYEMSWSTGEVESLIHPKKIRIEYLENNNLTETGAYEESKKSIAQHRQHTLYRKLLVTGHPRCGSGYSSALFSSLGLDVGHEAMRADGISSWMFAVYDENNPYALNSLASTRLFTYFEYHIQHVRDPRTAIPSIVTENTYSEESFCFRRKHILEVFGIDIAEYDSDIERATASLIYWTQIIENQKPNFVFRIEDQANELIEFCKRQRLATKRPDDIELPIKQINSGKPYNGMIHDNPDYSEKQYKKMDVELIFQLNSYCELYGYDPFP